MIYIGNTTVTQYIPIPYPRTLDGSGEVLLTLTDEASGEAVNIVCDGYTEGDYLVAEVTLSERLRAGEYHYTLRLSGDETGEYDTKGVAVVGEYLEPYINDTTEGINIIQYER